MSDLSSAAKANLESARQPDGKFGNQPHSNPGQLSGLTEEQPTCVTSDDGVKKWQLNGEPHRTDGPAIEFPDGYKAWYLNGERHRTDGPAIETPEGDKEWYVDGVPHRTDGPAIEQSSGAKMWYLNGKRLTRSEYAERTA